MSFQRDFKCHEKTKGDPTFLVYEPAWELEQRARRTAYLRNLAEVEAIKVGDEKFVFSVDAPLFTDKKYSQPGAG